MKTLEKTSNWVAVILAAGKGTRMKSKVPKVLHPVLGKPMMAYVVEACLQAGVHKLVGVIGSDGEAIKRAISGISHWVVQSEPLGTGHALLQARPFLERWRMSFLVLAGDKPCLTAEEIQRIRAHHSQSHPAATLLTAILEQPADSGRVLRDSQGRFLRIVEQTDPSFEDLQTREVNASLYAFDPQVLPLLDELKPHEPKGEYYLTDLPEILRNHGLRVETVQAQCAEVVQGVNTRSDLARAVAILKRRTLEKLMRAGVTVIDPDSTFVEADVEIGADTVLYPFTYIRRGAVIGKNCRIGPFVKLGPRHVPDGSVIEGVWEDDQTGSGFGRPSA